MKQKTLFVESEIDRRMEAFRIKRNFTLERMANQTGFTKGSLSKRENSEKHLPLAGPRIAVRAPGIAISILAGQEAQQTSFHAT